MGVLKPVTRMLRRSTSPRPDGGTGPSARVRINAHWDWTDGVAFVRVPRTLAMDDCLHAFKSQLFAVPGDYRALAGGEYARHLMAPVRVTEPDAFGQPVATFKHTLPDDFCHAEVYAMLATTRSGSGGVFFIDFEGRRLINPMSPSHPDLEFCHR